MSDHAILIAVVAATVLYAAWYEYNRDNRRDAGLLAVLGAGGLLGGAAAWLA